MWGDAQSGPSPTAPCHMLRQAGAGFPLGALIAKPRQVGSAPLHAHEQKLCRAYTRFVRGVGLSMIKVPQVRTLVQRELNAALGEWDLLLSPAAPTTAYRIGEARHCSNCQRSVPDVSWTACPASSRSAASPLVMVFATHTAITDASVRPRDSFGCMCQVCDDPLEMYQGDLMTVNLNLAGASPCSLQSRSVGTSGLWHGRVLKDGQLGDDAYYFTRAHGQGRHIVNTHKQ